MVVVMELPEGSGVVEVPAGSEVAELLDESAPGAVELLDESHARSTTRDGRGTAPRKRGHQEHCEEAHPSTHPPTPPPTHKHKHKHTDTNVVISECQRD